MLFNHFLSVFLTLFLSHSINCLTQKAYYISDLESTGASFDTESTSWSVTGNTGVAPHTYTCVTTPTLGGGSKLNNAATLTRTYTTLPTHDIIYLSFTIWLLDEI